MIYALINSDGSCVIRHGLDGHEDEVAECSVWEIEREPRADLGERVCCETGCIIFDLSVVQGALVDAIKDEARRRILGEASFERQLNDLRCPDEAGVAERSARIEDIRAWSNLLEGELSKACSPGHIARVQERLRGAPD